MTDQWVTYAPDLSGNWLMQGFDIVEGVVTKTAETAVAYPYPAGGPVENDFYDLVESPLGGVALVGKESDGTLSLTRYRIASGEFVQVDQFTASAPSSFTVTANYVVLRPAYPHKGTYEVLSLKDLSPVTTFDPEALGLVVTAPFLGTKGVVGDTLFFLDNSADHPYEWAKGVNLSGGAPTLISLDGSPTSNGDAYVRLAVGVDAQSRDRWQVFASQLVQGWTTDSGVLLGEFFSYNHTLIDADGRLTTVQFPVIDGRFSVVLGVGTIQVGVEATQWFFGEPDESGDIEATWIGYAVAKPTGAGTAAVGPHRFHGTVTIPNEGGTVTATVTDDGLCGATIFGQFVADSGWRGRLATSFSAAVSLRELPVLSQGQNWNWYAITPDRTITELQDIDPESESVPNLFFSYPSNAPYGIPLSVITGELVESGRNFS